MRLSDSDFAGQLSEVICIEYKWRRDELMELPVGVYMAVADLENDKILITNERLKKSWMLLTSVFVEKDTKKARNDAARVVRENVEKLELVSKGTVVKTYGKDIADKAPVCAYMKNPHCSSSFPMKLYLVVSLKHLYGERTFVK